MKDRRYYELDTVSWVRKWTMQLFLISSDYLCNARSGKCSALNCAYGGERTGKIGQEMREILNFKLIVAVGHG